MLVLAALLVLHSYQVFLALDTPKAAGHQANSGNDRRSQQRIRHPRQMSSAMSRYNAGMRGEAVVAGASEHGRTEEGAMGSGSGNAPINVNYSGPIMRMNNDDYVKTSELPGIINQSAKAGEARALGRLRTSVGVRRKLGMS